MRKTASVVVALAGLILALTTSAHSQSFGIRTGFSANPDQFVLGGQVEVGMLGFARIVPSVDVGFGDNLTTIAFNGDFLLRVQIPDASIELYAGGGPTVLYADVNDGPSDWNLGLSAVLGGMVPVGATVMHLEGRFGIGDAPDFKLIAAIML